MMRFDVPNDKRNKLNWHQDSSYYMMAHPKFNAGVCWCAVTKNSEKNGTLKFIPKSHSKYIKVKLKKKNNSISEKFTLNIYIVKLWFSSTQSKIFLFLPCRQYFPQIIYYFPT